MLKRTDRTRGTASLEFWSSNKIYLVSCLLSSYCLRRVAECRRCAEMCRKEEWRLQAATAMTPAKLLVSQFLTVSHRVSHNDLKRVHKAQPFPSRLQSNLWIWEQWRNILSPDELLLSTVRRPTRHYWLSSTQFHWAMWSPVCAFWLRTSEQRRAPRNSALRK